jgi:hypothetical protein
MEGDDLNNYFVSGCTNRTRRFRATNLVTEHVGTWRERWLRYDRS